MVPVPITARRSSRFLYITLSAATNYASKLLFQQSDSHASVLVKRESKFNPHSPGSIVSAILIPVLVLSSGLFAGLTLGYMSLDETQLNVLSISGSPEQRKYANKIMPIRKNGHLLLVTLLLANMIVNETLPVIADPVLGGGVIAVVVSTVLIVIFSEIIPQSLFTRHGLYLGAKMAGFTKILIYTLGVIAWPVAKLLEFVLGAHHGIIYRRAELKELIAMHSNQGAHGGDLKTDTVTIIGATLDLQEKVVRQAMTPISDVFMLSIDSKLDYALLKKICQTGHSRVPVYEEVDVPVSFVASLGEDTSQAVESKQGMTKVKKIIGILLVKQCVLLDPKDATPLRKIPLNKVPFVPNNEPLLGILDRFQEGRSHMAIVSRFSVEKAASVKKAVKTGLTQRLRKRVGMDTDSDTETETSDEEKRQTFSTEKKKRSSRPRLLGGRKSSKDAEEGLEDGETIKESDGPTFVIETSSAKAGSDSGHGDNVESEKTMQDDCVDSSEKRTEEQKKAPRKTKIPAFQLPKVASAMTSMSLLEQDMPADAVLAKKGAAEFLQGYDPAVMPLGIITLEDVLEELIGEEIYDEFDDQGAHGDPYEVPPAPAVQAVEKDASEAVPAITVSQGSRPPSISQRPTTSGSTQSHTQKLTPSIQVPGALKGLGFFRTRSAPPVPRDSKDDDALARAADTGEKTVRIDEGANVEIPRPLAHTTSTPAGGASIVMPRPIRGSRSPPSVILEQHSSLSSSESNVLSLTTFPGAPDSPPPQLPTTDGRPSAPPLPGAVGLSASVGGAPRTPTRTASPAPVPSPALEAILLDRKRRLLAANLSTGTPHSAATTPPAGVAASTAHGPLSPMPSMSRDPSAAPSISPATSVAGAVAAAKGTAGATKGTRFKSSPLGGFDRTGIVVAEQVNAAYSQTGQDTREPDAADD